MTRRRIVIGALGLLAFCVVASFLVSTFGNMSPEAQATATQRADEREATRAERTVEAIAEATEEARPTNTPAPTNTPEPTNTPAPTDTPRPTLTPTPLPEPILLEGSGDTVVDVDWVFGPAIAVIRGNSGSRHFAVTSLDRSNNTIDLLVNTTEPYDGMRPINFTSQEVARFEVSADGSWSIEIRPLAMADALTVPGTFEGSGDHVFLLEGATPDTARVIGNSSGRHFAVHGWIPGELTDLLVNTTDLYDGTVLLDPDTLIIQVTAVGSWTIGVTAR